MLHATLKKLGCVSKTDLTDVKKEIQYASAIISKTRIINEPYSHIIVDDVLSSDMLEKMHTLWPGKDLFINGDSGNPVLSISDPNFKHLPRSQFLFWNKVCKHLFPAIVHSAMEKFSGSLWSVFEDLILAPQYGAIPMFMQSNRKFTGHSMHTHFYHNPNWVMTALLYVGPDDGSEGTTLWQPKRNASGIKPDIMDVSHLGKLVDIAMDVRGWDHRQDLEPAKTVAYKSNRFFCFLDGPLALHGVLPTVTEKEDARRIIRCHVSVALEDFLKNRLNFRQSGDPHKTYCNTFLPPATTDKDKAEYNAPEVDMEKCDHDRQMIIKFITEELVRREHSGKAGPIPPLPPL